MIKRILATTAVIGLVSSPALAQAERLPAPVEQSEGLEGESGLLLTLFAAVAVFTGFLLVFDTDNPDTPTSP